MSFFGVGLSQFITFAIVTALSSASLIVSKRGKVDQFVYSELTLSLQYLMKIYPVLEIYKSGCIK